MYPSRTKEAKQRYGKSVEGKEAAQRYRESVKGKTTRQRWKDSAAGKAARLQHDSKYRYGIAFEDYERLWAAQGERCAACGESEPRGGRWHVDHCHETREIRGIICLKCNVSLGMAEDNPDRLLDLLNYLRGE